MQQLKLKYTKRQFNMISHLKVQSLIDDTKDLTKGLKKRREAFVKWLWELVPSIRSAAGKAELDELLQKNKINSYTSDNEIRTYLKANQRSFGESQIY